jgi:hypothetical protein
VEEAPLGCVEPAAAAGLALDELESGDLPLDWAVAPGQRQRGQQPGALAPQPVGEPRMSAPAPADYRGGGRV